MAKCWQYYAPREIIYYQNNDPNGMYRQEGKHQAGALNRLAIGDYARVMEWAARVRRGGKRSQLQLYHRFVLVVSKDNSVWTLFYMVIRIDGISRRYILPSSPIAAQMDCFPKHLIQGVLMENKAGQCSAADACDKKLLWQIISFISSMTLANQAPPSETPFICLWN